MGDHGTEKTEENNILVLLLAFETGFHNVAQATLTVCLSILTQEEYDSSTLRWKLRPIDKHESLEANTGVHAGHQSP